MLTDTFYLMFIFAKVIKRVFAVNVKVVVQFIFVA